MGIPATTGQLRTKVSEMEIGDYIWCRGLLFNPTTIARLGNPEISDNEIPLTGLSAASSFGYFYFVKVATGLLVADRVLQNTVSWDQLNAWKLIQGVPWTGPNIIPTMTSNTSPSGVASASSIWASSYDAWRAFDKAPRSTSDVMWMAENNNSKGWLAYEFAESKIIKRYTIKSRGASPTSAPKSWTFEGSVDGINWTILDSKTNQISTAASDVRSYNINNTVSYKHYRINISESNGTNVGIEELEMFDTAGIIRSLTGGVAYADANGNKLTTATNSVGVWPVNNEFDKYIMNFPSNLIKSGFTLKDVFHQDSPYSWLQDTPAVEIAASTNRMRRGNKNHNSILSSTANVYTGFRPVFAYQE